MLSSPLTEVMDKAETIISFQMMVDLCIMLLLIEDLLHSVIITTKEHVLSRNVLIKHSANLKLQCTIHPMEVVEIPMSLRTMVEHVTRIVTLKPLTSVIIPTLGTRNMQNLRHPTWIEN